MEHQKTVNLLNEISGSKFVTKKWKIASDQLSKNYDLGSEVIYYTEVLNSNLCDFNDACILVRGNIITTRRNNPTQVVFKNFAPFINCITEIEGLTIMLKAEIWSCLCTIG